MFPFEVRLPLSPWGTGALYHLDKWLPHFRAQELGGVRLWLGRKRCFVSLRKVPLAKHLFPPPSGLDPKHWGKQYPRLAWLWAAGGGAAGRGLFRHLWAIMNCSHRIAPWGWTTTTPPFSRRTSPLIHHSLVNSSAAGWSWGSQNW